MVIPSLMFLIRDKNKTAFNSFLQKFFTDGFFYLQLLILLLLAAVAAKPFMVVPSISHADTMVIVIDASASMNALEDGKTRFERAVEYAREHVGSRNTIILATARSQLIVENENRQDTLQALRTLQPRHTPLRDFYETIVLAENFAQGDYAGVLIISDFATSISEEQAINGRLYLQSKGIDAFIHDVSLNKARNVGIIDLEVKDTETTVWVKNFMEEEQEIVLTYGDRSEEASIGSGDVVSFVLTTLPGTTEIRIDVEDDFPLDNVAYTSTPEEQSTTVLVIANEENQYLTTALELTDRIVLDRQQPPVVAINNPDVIILGSIQPGLMIPGDVAKIRRLVHDEGVPLIIMGQDDLLALGLGDLFPMELAKAAPMSTNEIVVPTQDNSYLTPDGIQFGQARKIYDAQAGERVTVIAETTSGIPAITMSTMGKGRILYYGLFDDVAEFKADIYYPVFWKRVFDVTLGGQTLAELNRKTGYLETLGREQTVNTPVGYRRGSAITLDYTGLYHFTDYTIAANLLTEQEQRLNRATVQLEASELSSAIAQGENQTRKKDISLIVLFIITGLLLVELIIIKIRGDI